MAGKFTLEAIFKGNDQLSKVFASIEGRAGRFSAGVSAGLKDIEKINGKLLGGLSNIAKQAAAVGAVVGGIGVAAGFNVLKTGSDFEQAITNVGAVSLSTRKEIRALEDEALELGLKTKFTATEAANAMETMARAGFTNAEVLAGIPGLLSAAAAEGITPGEVTEVVAATIKGMRLAASETNRVADVFALASAKTKSSIMTLGESMATVSPVAAQLGVSVEDATAAVALLQDTGLDASVAGSAVATMLTNISKPSTEVAAKMKEFGITFKDAKGNMLPFVDVLKNIQIGAQKSGGNLDQMAFFSDLLGMRGQKAGLNLAKAFESGKFEELSKQLQGAAGSAEKMANIRIDTLQGDLTLLNSSIDIVKIGLTNLGSDGLRKVVQQTNNWVIANKSLIISKVQDFILDVAKALPTIVLWAERIGKMVMVVGTFMLAIKIATGAMALFNAVAAVNPWVLLVYGIVALTAAVVAFWPEIKNHELAFRRAGLAIVAVTTAVGAAAVAYGVFLAVTNASTIATIAYVGWVLVARGAMTIWTVATNLQNIKTIALTAVQWLQTAAVAAYNGVLGLGQAAMALFTGETITMSGAMTAALGPVLALVAALGALYLAKKANDSLKEVTGGLGMGGIASEMWKQGTFSPFTAVDEYQNQQARAKAGMPSDAAPTVPGVPVIPGMPALPGMPAGQDPQAMIAALLAQQGGLPGATSAKGQAPAQSAKETGESLAKAMGPALTEALKKGKGEITVTVKGGEGTVDKQPESGFVLNMTPSGAF